MADTPRTADTPHVQESPTPSNRPTLRSRDDVSRSNPSVTTDQPRTIQRDDTPRRGETSNAPDRSRPVTRTDGNNNSNNASPSTNNRISRDTPVIRNDNQGAKGSNEIDRSITRDREDVARSIARPSTTTDSNRNQPQVGDVSRNGSNSTGQFSRGGPITRSDTTGVRGGANIGTGSGSPVFRSNDNVARSISRPQAGASRINRQPSDVVSRTNTTIDRNDPITMKRTDTSRTTTANDRSLPISRSRDGTTRTAGRTPPGVERPITSNFSRTAPDIARNPRGATQIGAGRDMNVTSNAGTRGFNNSRTIDRSTSFANRGVARDDSVRTASAVRRDGTIRTASFHDSSTVAHAKVGGRDIFIREAHGAHGKDVYVINAGHFRPDHWPHGDYRPHGDGDDWRHGDDWHHGEWHDGEWRHDRHFDFDVSFTFVHSYCAPAGVVYYDVMPVEPVVYASPVYSLSFAYVGHHSSVVISSVRYIEPVAFAPPTMVVYPAVYAAPIVTPVVYSPIVASPVVAAVPVPVVTPAYAPMYYYYPAYTYYPVYSAVVAPAYVVEQAPAPVVAAPAVVEAPSSSWSIGTAFSFLGHHGKSFSLGGSFTKVNSEPAVVAAPAVVSPAAAVEPVPAGASPAEAVAPTAAAEASAAGTTLDAGLAAIRAGEMDKARSILSQVVISDPDNGMARMLYAAALLADGRYKESAESLRRSLETWSDFELKDFYLPAVYDNPKVFTQVMRDVREFLSDHPERIDAWLLVAWSYAVSGQSNEATMLLTEARKSWPEDSIFGTLDKVVQANERAEQATASAK